MLVILMFHIGSSKLHISAAQSVVQESISMSFAASSSYKHPSHITHVFRAGLFAKSLSRDCPSMIYIASYHLRGQLDYFVLSYANTAICTMEFITVLKQGAEKGLKKGRMTADCYV